MTSLLNVTSPRTRSSKVDVGVVGHAEADDRAFARVDPAPRLLPRETAAGAGVLRRAAGGERRLPLGVELLRRAEAVIGVIAGEQLVGVRRVEVQPLRLAVRAVRAVDVGALVPVEPEPAKILEDADLRLARRALGVGVLDAQDERAVLAVCQQPVEQRRARVADVQLAGRARSKSESHSKRVSSRAEAPAWLRSATARRRARRWLRRGRWRPRLRWSCP